MNKTSFDANRESGLTKDLVSLVETKLSPVAIKYGYAETSLDQMIKWKPLVLVLGSYSSGKSTLINELLGMPIQDTGQAPTDDSFTLITHSSGVERWEELEGTAVINDPDLPFRHLSKFGKRFASHLKMKRVAVPLLNEVVLIDTPGMLDSVSEKDRGYDYQAVISELAALADLIVVLFDPHRPGTVRETHELLRRTLPAVSYENRTVFVLNRIDECENLNDLLRTYGTLCWNLSQMTGRKDIPKIFLSYREHSGNSEGFLSLLGNQREAVKKNILDAPKHRLEHLVSFTESHGKNLQYFLSVLEHYGRRRRDTQLKGFLVSLAAAGVFAAVIWLLWFFGALPAYEFETLLLIIAGLGAVACLTSLVVFQLTMMKRFHSHTMSDLEGLATIESQAQGDAWAKVRTELESYLSQRQGRFSLLAVKRDSRKIRGFLNQVHSQARSNLSKA